MVLGLEFSNAGTSCAYEFIPAQKTSIANIFFFIVLVNLNLMGALNLSVDFIVFFHGKTVLQAMDSYTRKIKVEFVLVFYYKAI